ncbi:MAG: hypothetical protein HQK83_09315 [Fibrobacteria bacterium]|nr:hypothetical protein [Fibrobacteria bacterium]
MRIISMVILCVAFPVLVNALEYSFPKSSWETKTPAELGLDAGAMNAAAASLGGNGAIIRYGYVAKAWGNGLAAKTDWASSCKPVFSLLVWKAVKDGKISSFQAPVKDLMTDRQFNEKDAKITFYHLAHMTSGWSRAEAPGEAFSYNDEAINLYGKAVYNYLYQSMDPSATLKSELAALQFEHNPVLDASKTGRFTSVSVGDMARIAHLFLNQGNWNGTAIVDSANITEMMGQTVPVTLPLTKGDATPSFNAGTSGGTDYQYEGNNGPGSYSYNFWLNKGKRLWPSLTANVFQGNGHWGRENYTVFPNQQLIVLHYGKTLSHSQMNTIYSALLGGVTGNPIMTDTLQDTTSWDKKLTLGKKVQITNGIQPMCVLDKNENLHIIYKGNQTGDEGIKYLKMNFDGELSDKFTLSSSGDNPQITIDVNGDIHAVWDTFSASYYRKKTGTNWEDVIDLPRPKSERNWFPHVAAGPDGTAYWGLWGIQGSPNTTYAGWLDGSVPRQLYAGGENRPPRLLGPTDRYAGDGNVYLIPGDRVPVVKNITSTGTTDYKTLSVFSQKTGEGYSPFWMKGQPALVFNEVLSGTTPCGIVFNYLPDNVAYLVSGPITEEASFPRAAYDETNDLVYVFWHEHGEVFYTCFDNGSKTASPKISMGKKTGAGRGCGAGGIAYTGNGGVYLVYSDNGMLQRQVLGNYSAMVSIERNNTRITSNKQIYGLDNRIYDIKGRHIQQLPKQGNGRTIHITREGRKFLSE